MRALLRRVVDYAGLFPPAALSMPDAVTRYAAHLRSADAWMLGRFVLPVERLDELADVANPSRNEGGEPWRLSALIGAQSEAAGPTIRAFNARHRGRILVDVVECQPMPAGRVAGAIGALPGELRIFVEVPIVADPRDMLAEIGQAGAWAKMRTGGVTMESLPASRDVARFIARAAELKVPFKATAGLHHPFTGVFPLTYAEDAPRGRMFGFVNLFAAAVFAQQNASEALLMKLLEDDDPHAFTFDNDVLRRRDLTANARQIASARSSLGVSFGSCSFDEPVDGLRASGLL